MQINHLLPAGLANAAQSIKADSKVIDAFTDLLKQQSEQYGAEASHFDTNKLEADFNVWKNKYVQSNIGAERKAAIDTHASSFVALMKKAGQKGGYANPQAFLQSLSSEELAVLQKIHGLADPIKPHGLNKEGALNLLLPPNSGKDIDKDGFVSIGLAKTWAFPPTDAPEKVKQAWAAATEGMTPTEKLLAMGPFMPMLSPDGETKSAYLGPDASYTDLVRDVLDKARLAQRFDEPWQRDGREKQIRFLETFLANLG